MDNRNQSPGPLFANVSVGGTSTASAGNAGNQDTPVVVVETATDKKPRAPRKPKEPTGASITPVYGHVDMRAYPMTMPQMLTLGVLGLLSNFLFSVAVGLFVYSFDITRDIEMDANMAQPIAAAWRQVATLLCGLGVASAALGIATFAFGGWSVFQIVKKTKFPTEVGGNAQ